MFSVGMVDHPRDTDKQQKQDEGHEQPELDGRVFVPLQAL